jgi:N-acyl-D-aspartate/D-glutamate deacylase
MNSDQTSQLADACARRLLETVTVQPLTDAGAPVLASEWLAESYVRQSRYDLPGGAKRIVMPSRGVEYTVVNGAVTWEQGKLHDAKAGKVLRG